MARAVVYVAVLVSDQDVALDFYTKVLGFEKRGDYSQFRASTKGREKGNRDGLPLRSGQDRSVRLAFQRNGGQPGDLAYWVGYRIVKSYYQHAVDKRRPLGRSLTDSKAARVFCTACAALLDATGGSAALTDESRKRYESTMLESIPVTGSR